MAPRTNPALLLLLLPVSGQSHLRAHSARVGSSRPNKPASGNIIPGYTEALEKMLDEELVLNLEAQLKKLEEPDAPKPRGRNLEAGTRESWYETNPGAEQRHSNIPSKPTRENIMTGYNETMRPGKMPEEELELKSLLELEALLKIEEPDAPKLRGRKHEVGTQQSWYETNLGDEQRHSNIPSKPTREYIMTGYTETLWTEKMLEEGLKLESLLKLEARVNGQEIEKEQNSRDVSNLRKEMLSEDTKIGIIRMELDLEELEKEAFQFEF